MSTMSTLEPLLYVPLYDAYIPVSVFDKWALGLIRRAVTALVLVGLCTVLLFVLLLLRRKDHFIHWAHILIILTQIIRLALDLSVVDGPLLTIAFGVMGVVDFDVMKAYLVLAAALCLTMLLMLLIELCLVYQAWTIFRPYARQWWCWVVVAITSALGLVTFAFELTAIVMGINAQVRQHFAEIYDPMHKLSSQVPGWVTGLPYILFTVLICWGLFLLVCKLAYALRLRQKLGLSKFDHLHVLMIMGTQTMIVPAITMIVNHALFKTVDKVLLQVLILLVVLSLPLALMWAQMQNEHRVLLAAMLYVHDDDQLTLEPVTVLDLAYVCETKKI